VQGAYFEGRSVYPEYLTDINVTLCPSSGALGESQDRYERALNNPETLPIIVNRGTGNFVTPYAGQRASVADIIRSSCYYYFGWVMDGEQTMENAAYRAGATANTAGGGGFAAPHVRVQFADKDLDMTLANLAGHGTAKGNILYRIKEGVERFLITDINNPAGSSKAQSSIWVSMDLIGGIRKGNNNQSTMNYFNHVPGGANVLYMDGHVRFLKYSEEGEWPVNEQMAWYAHNNILNETAN
jgi:prepilin-type processing-associated H-X9-DG protein